MPKYGYNGMGFDWTPEAEAIVHKMKNDGFKAREIAHAISQKYNTRVSLNAIHSKILNMKIPCMVEKTPGVKIYRHRRLPDGDYMISCDYHAPFHSEAWANRLLEIAQRFKVRKHIIVGDLFDCDWAKAHLSTDGEERLGLDKEAAYSDPLIKALVGNFDENILICGNHETRPARNVIKVQFRHIAGFLGLDLAQKRYQFTEYDKMEIGSKWLLVHPKSYSQVSGSVGVRLAEKFHRHALNAHGHFIALRYDRSGQYMGVDLGGMFDQRKVAYSSLVTTTHPFWNNGFGMIYKGHFYHFHNGADWKFWIEGDSA